MTRSLSLEKDSTTRLINDDQLANERERKKEREKIKSGENLHGLLSLFGRLDDDDDDDDRTLFERETKVSVERSPIHESNELHDREHRIAFESNRNFNV